MARHSSGGSSSSLHANKYTSGEGFPSFMLRAEIILLKYESRFTFSRYRFARSTGEAVATAILMFFCDKNLSNSSAPFF